MRVGAKLRGMKPLLYLNGRLIVANGARLYWINRELSELEHIATLPVHSLRRWVGMNRLAARALRFEAGPAVQLGTSLQFFVFLEGQGFLVDTQTGAVQIEPVRPRGRAPLMMTYNPEGREAAEGIYFGDYFSNATKSPAQIWHRGKNGEWHVAHSFAQGEVNHIHAVTPDSYNGALYILTGDYGSAPSIWLAKGFFSSVEKILDQGQQSRSCWIKPDEDHLLFATDTHLESNALYSLDRQDFGKPGAVRKVTDTIGSSIYAVHDSTGLSYFSTAVEPDVATGKYWADLLTRQRGPGITEPVSAIYAGSNATGFRRVFEAPKDAWPLRLFGFGTFCFPAGTAPDTGWVHCYARGLKGIDGMTLLLES